MAFVFLPSGSAVDTDPLARFLGGVVTKVLKEEFPHQVMSRVCRLTSRGFESSTAAS